MHCSADDPAQKTKRYTQEHFSRALEAFANWDGEANDFKPDGLPKYFYLSKKAKTNPAFAAAFAIAREARTRRLMARVGNGLLGRRRFHGYTQEQFESYLDAIRTSPCVTKTKFRFRKLPGLPNWSTAKRRASFDPEFAKKLQAALEFRGWQKGKCYRPKNVNRSSRYDFAAFIKSIDLFAVFTGASNFYFKPPKGLPGYQAIVRAAQASPKIAEYFAEAKTRREALLGKLGVRIGVHVGRGHKRKVSEEDIQSYLGQIRAGATRRSLEKTTPFSKDVRQRLFRESPAFVALVSAATRVRLAAKLEASKARRRERERLRSKARTKARSKSVYEVGQLRVYLNLNEYYAIADRALATYRHMPDYALDDIRSDMVEALINQTLQAEDACDCAFEFVANYNREFSTHRTISTEEKLFDDGTATRGDYLTTDDYSYAE